MKIDLFDGDNRNTSVKSISLIPFFEHEPVKSISPSLKQATEEVGFAGKPSDIRIITLLSKEGNCHLYYSA